MVPDFVLSQLLEQLSLSSTCVLAVQDPKVKSSFTIEVFERDTKDVMTIAHTHNGLFIDKQWCDVTPHSILMSMEGAGFSANDIVYMNLKKHLDARSKTLTMKKIKELTMKINLPK